MSTLDIGAVAPEFTAEGAGGATLTLSQLRGRQVVLYFYPKDDTSGCTKEAQAFSDAQARFETAGSTVIGVSPDSVASHDKFAKKYALNVALAADPDHAIAEAYGVWVEKSMYGRSYLGIERSTFLIDAEGVIRAVWRKVKVPGHVDAVLQAITG